MRVTLDVNQLAHRRWELHGRPAHSALDDWPAAERLRHQVIEEAAYFRWLNRGRPIGDPDTDWFAAEAEITKVIEEAAYFLWLNRGGPIGDDWADWVAAEAEVVSCGATSRGYGGATNWRDTRPGLVTWPATRIGAGS